MYGKTIGCDDWNMMPMSAVNLFVHFVLVEFSTLKGSIIQPWSVLHSDGIHYKALVILCYQMLLCMYLLCMLEKFCIMVLGIAYEREADIIMWLKRNIVISTYLTSHISLLSIFLKSIRFCFHLSRCEGDSDILVQLAFILICTSSMWTC